MVSDNLGAGDVDGRFQTCPMLSFRLLLDHSDFSRSFGSRSAPRRRSYFSQPGASLVWPCLLVSNYFRLAPRGQGFVLTQSSVKVVRVDVLVVRRRKPMRLSSFILR